MIVVSVNVGGIRTIRYRGKDVKTGIFKEPVKGKVPLRGVNLRGDDQADRKVHGGHDQAVYARFIKRFASALRPGAYFSVIEEGEIEEGDSIEVVSRPDHHLTIADTARIYLFEHDRFAELLVPELPAAWRASIESQGERA